MSGLDDNVVVIGDWAAPSPSPRTFFSAMLGDDFGLRQTQEPTSECKNDGLFLGSQGKLTSGNAEKGDGGQSDGQLTGLGSYSDQKSTSRGNLVERMAARAGFNAPRLNTEGIRSADLSLNSDPRSSPYLTIPPGLSPTSLLDSPVFLSNSLVQPSPTTGKFLFASNVSDKNSALMSDAFNRSENNPFEDSSFAFKPVAESGSTAFTAGCKMTVPMFSQRTFSETSVHAENSLQPHSGAPAQVPSQGSSLNLQVDLSRVSIENESHNNTLPSDQRIFDNIGGTESSSPLDELQDDEGDQKGSGDSVITGCGGAPSEDGYNWRKYGQKQVKGSEYPRSYYKCTHPNCQVKKKVERSHEGHITEIIYKGIHNHTKPPPSRRSVVGGCNPLNEMQLDNDEHGGPQSGVDADPKWANMQKATATVGALDWRQDNVEVTSSASDDREFSVQAQNGAQFETGEAVDASLTFSNDECEDDQATHGSVTLGYDGEGDESESKRRKIEAYAADMSGATRAIREPRVVVQTTSEVDILDDGYRWRKYGQKVVKGNPNPRSYYKCTSAGCTVRKHVERASHDLKSVITTYEGKHNHDVPAARNSSHVNSGVSGPMANHSAASAVQTHMHRPESAQVHSSLARFEGSASLGSFSLPGRPRLGPSPGFSFGMNPPGFASLAMANLGPGQAKLSMMPVHPFLSQQCQVNELGLILPKGEPKAEPISEPGSNLSNNSSVYQQFMNRLPLGPQM